MIKKIAADIKNALIMAEVCPTDENIYSMVQLGIFLLEAGCATDYSAMAKTIAYDIRNAKKHK